MRTTGLTYRDLEHLPEDGRRYEILDGELVVTAAPRPRHQQVLIRLTLQLVPYADELGGLALVGVGLLLSDDVFPIPDLIYLSPDRTSSVEESFVRGAADLLVEVSSPSTRRRDLTWKKAAYARFGVNEYWFIDLDADRVEAYRLSEGGYGPPSVVERGQALTSPRLPGFSVPIAELLGEPQL